MDRTEDQVGVCSICGKGVPVGESFINTGPTDWNDPNRPPSVAWIPVDTDIHGWTPFVLAHPTCWTGEHSVEELAVLVDESIGNFAPNAGSA